MTYKVLDLFAGSGGWEVGARYIGLDTDQILGIEWDSNACETARAAGFLRFQADVSLIDPSTAAHLNVIEGLIASPPCQAWSAAGKKLGLLDQQRIYDHLDAVVKAGRWIDYNRDGWNDERSYLVLEPLRYALELNPIWIALEQVPAVLPYWERLGDVLRVFGWSVATGNLTSEQYGVPQTRKRAILVASRDHEVALAALPAPIMQSYRKGRPDDGSGLPMWVSMAQALGWGLDDRPSWTVSGGGTATGGAEVFANAANRNMWQARDSGPGAERDPRSADDPSYTIRANGSGSNPSGVKWVEEDEHWGHTRPATTIMGDARVSQPGGHHEPGKQSQNATRVTINEAAVLQSFPADHPLQGGKGAQFRQIGDACPPLLAAAILGELLMIPWQNLCAGHYLTDPTEGGKFQA